MMPSMRFRNSGRKVRRSSPVTARLTRSCRSRSPPSPLAKPRGCSWVIWEAPTLLVITTTAFLKSAFLPWLSVRQPSSRICSSRFQTERWAFSISSKSTTE